MIFDQNKFELEENGFSITSRIYDDSELTEICRLIDKKVSFSESQQLYSIRNLFQEIPGLTAILLNDVLRSLLKTVGGDELFLTKAIYFDKPEGSNWFVPYHQDLFISVAEKHDAIGYQNWTIKNDQFGVQPPTKVLENTVTVRIHLDDADENNGALKVVPKSHINGVIRLDRTKLNTRDKVTCSVLKGRVMLMKPLIFHASKRSSNGKQRRVIHLEFCDQELEAPLNWIEQFLLT